MNHNRIKHIKGIIIVVLVAVLILAGVIFAFYRFSPNNSAKTKSTDTNTEANQQSITESKEQVAHLDSKLGASPSKATLNNAQAELAQLAKTATTNDAKQIYLSKSVELYAYNKDYQSALLIALQAEQIKPTALTAADFGYIYQKLSDYRNAAKYYQLAADRSDKTTDPKEKSPYNDYMISKREVEALIK